jgi:hypothetical protein
MLGLVLALLVGGSGLAFHALARSPSEKARRRGPWLVAAAFGVASVALLAPFIRLDPSRLISGYIAPQLLFNVVIFVEGALIARWIFARWPQRWKFLAAYVPLLVVAGGLTSIVAVSVYPGS